MDVNFELYKIFYHVAKNLSFSRAAEELFVSQSAVSQSVKALEEKMKCRLLVRNTKQVALTREGEVLFKHVEQACNFIRAGERGIHEIKSLKQGEIRIGASDTVCKHYLLPFLKKFCRLYPQIKVRITNRTSPRCIELLQNGSVDLAVVNLPETGVANNLRVSKVKEVQDVLIAGKHFAHLKDRVIELRELERYPLLMLEKNTTTRDFIDAFLAKKGVNVTPEIELESMDLLVELARIGLGMAFAVKNYIEKELAAGGIFMVATKEKIPARSLGIVTNSSIPVSMAAGRFIDLLTNTKGVPEAK